MLSCLSHWASTFVYNMKQHVINPSAAAETYILWHYYNELCQFYSSNLLNTKWNIFVNINGT